MSHELTQTRSVPLQTPVVWLTALTVTVAVLCVFAGRHWVHYPHWFLYGIAVGSAVTVRRVVMGRTPSPWRVAAFLLLYILACTAVAHPHPADGFLLAALAFSIMLGPTAAPRPAGRLERQRVWELVNRTANDTLAPFALRTDKSYVFSPDGRAALAFRVRWGTAVASGDPVGEVSSHHAAIHAFCRRAAENGWRIAVLGASDRYVETWRHLHLWCVSIGQEVVVDVDSFHMTGRPARNLRQSVQHTHNCGVTTEIVAEAELSPPLRRELESLLRRAPKGLEPRGFAMILDRPLRCEHPGTLIALARNAEGTVVACQRYARADGGRELTLDIPWRLKDAPNGVDERLIIDTVAWARQQGASRISLSFAPFPELFGSARKTRLEQVAYWAAHRLDRFLQLESLYRFLRKFHAFGNHRYVAFRPLETVLSVASMLSLEFGPVAKHREIGERR